MNATQLSIVLSEQIAKLRTGKVDPKVSNAVANLASKLLSTQRLSIEYAKMTGQLPYIPFLTGTTKAALPKPGGRANAKGLNKPRKVDPAPAKRGNGSDHRRTRGA